MPSAEDENEAPVSSCAGILFFTSEMKARGEKPYCFGRRGSLRAGVEALEKNAAVDNASSSDSKKEKKPPAGFTYACVGYAQSTARVETGRVVTGRGGVEAWTSAAAARRRRRGGTAAASSRRRRFGGVVFGGRSRLRAVLWETRSLTREDGPAPRRASK